MPLTESTHHLIDAAALALMKPTGVLINTARGPVVDENALVDALEAGTIHGAGLDVFEGEPDSILACSTHPGSPCSRTSAARPSPPVRRWRAWPVRGCATFWPVAHLQTWSELEQSAPEVPPQREKSRPSVRGPASAPEVPQ